MSFTGSSNADGKDTVSHGQLYTAWVKDDIFANDHYQQCDRRHTRSQKHALARLRIQPDAGLPVIVGQWIFFTVTLESRYSRIPQRKMYSHTQQRQRVTPARRTLGW